MTVAQLEREMPMDEFMHWLAYESIRTKESSRRGRADNPFPTGSSEAAMHELLHGRD